MSTFSPAVMLSLTVLAGILLGGAQADTSPDPIAHRPAPEAGQEQAPPGTPNVHCESTKGSFTIEMHPEWSPLGAERFTQIVADGGYDGTVIYRVVKDQAVQFGYLKDEALRKKWQQKKDLQDEPQVFRDPNFHRGMISFAGGGKNTRGTDVFITFMTGNANGNPRAPWETPFGIIDEEGMKAITSFTSEYGDFESFGGHAPQLGHGYASLKKTHPNIDYLGKCTLVYPETTRHPRAPPRHDGGARGAPRALSDTAREMAKEMQHLNDPSLNEIVSHAVQLKAHHDNEPDSPDQRTRHVEQGGLVEPSGTRWNTANPKQVMLGLICCFCVFAIIDVARGGRRLRRLSRLL
eukprot:m.53569 g.53569  ORF g.53569 m.53569 type:complete len:350 (-) comp15451_c0_seq2:847-1896(-)